ncbi:hypothetical protein [Lentzea sp. NPDC055074]
MNELTGLQVSIVDVVVAALRADVAACRIDDEGMPRVREALGTSEVGSTVEFRGLSAAGDVRVG